MKFHTWILSGFREMLFLLSILINISQKSKRYKIIENKNISTLHHQLIYTYLEFKGASYVQLIKIVGLRKT